MSEESNILTCSENIQNANWTSLPYSLALFSLNSVKNVYIYYLDLILFRLKNYFILLILNQLTYIRDVHYDEITSLRHNGFHSDWNYHVCHPVKFIHDLSGNGVDVSTVVLPEFLFPFKCDGQNFLRTGRKLNIYFLSLISKFINLQWSYAAIGTCSMSYCNDVDEVLRTNAPTSPPPCHRETLASRAQGDCSVPHAWYWGWKYIKSFSFVLEMQFWNIIFNF